MPGLSFDHRKSEIAARVGVYRSDTSVLSFQAGLRSPGASFADSLRPFEVRRAASLDVRSLAGHNVVVAAMEGFVEAEGAIVYAAGQPGEWRIDLTMGLRPLPTSRDAAELHVDCKRLPPIRPYLLDQTATKLSL
jgi:protein XagA